jgi:hypothetical protein
MQYHSFSRCILCQCWAWYLNGSGYICAAAAKPLNGIFAYLILHLAGFCSIGDFAVVTLTSANLCLLHGISCDISG